MSRTPLPIHAVIRELKSASAAWNLPSVSQIAARTKSPFLVLISCLLSLRTKDAVTSAASDRLFARAKTPRQMLALAPCAIQKLIYPVAFYRVKSKRIHEICRHLISRFQGRVPNDLTALLTLPGVGRKTANLVVTVGFGSLGICVDTHVHRVSNRLGYVRTKTPEKTEMALRKKLPTKYWIIYNDLLVAFGQTVCRPVSPWCSRCPVASHCARIGVTHSR
ncbi:MAG: endonuclease III [Candidatus Omnitrophica bacterium]|nr:endonuclease III [Candidatus Omnitrophota bacterium]